MNALVALRSPSPQVFPAPRDVWRALVQASPDSMADQSPDWIDAICDSGAYHDASRYYVTPEGKRLVLPLVARGHLPPTLTVAASPPPAWGFGGVVSDQTLSADDLALVLDDLRRLPYLQVSIRPNPLQADLWQTAAASLPITAVPRRAHVLDLRGGFDDVWKKKYKNTTRTHVRRAERSGLTVELDTTGRLIPVYYGLYLRSLKRWAAQQHEPVAMARWRGQRRDPIHKIEAMARHLGDAFRLWVAWLDGEPVGAVLVMMGRNAHGTRMVMNKELARTTRANVLLTHLSIEDACTSGARDFHMGESGTSDALAQFKQEFGAQPYDYHQYLIERLPLTALNNGARGLVKRLIGFKDRA